MKKHDIGGWTHVWCEGCGCVRPLFVDVMGGTDVSGQFAEPTDLLCGVCRLVLATLYTPAPNPHEQEVCCEVKET
jgi:hypothetical protein